MTNAQLMSTPAQGRLADKVVFVTGAGSVAAGWGNGRAIAVRFAAEGARIFGVDRDEARMAETAALIRDAGGVFVAGTCDVTSSASIAAAVEHFAFCEAFLFTVSKDFFQKILSFHPAYPLPPTVILLTRIIG